MSSGFTLYNRLQAVLSAYGESSAFGEGEYWLLDDDWGNREHLLYIFREEFLTSEMIYKLKDILQDFEGWKLVVALDVVGWDKNVVPPMGLVISGRTIQDDLQREFLAGNLKDVVFPKS
jgi:hypothetical protein